MNAFASGVAGWRNAALIGAYARKVANPVLKEETMMRKARIFGTLTQLTGAVLLVGLAAAPALAQSRNRPCSVQSIAGEWMFATEVGQQALVPGQEGDITAIGTMNIDAAGNVSGEFDNTIAQFMSFTSNLRFFGFPGWRRYPPTPGSRGFWSEWGCGLEEWHAQRGRVVAKRGEQTGQAADGSEAVLLSPSVSEGLSGMLSGGEEPDGLRPARLRIVSTAGGGDLQQVDESWGLLYNKVVRRAGLPGRR